MREIGAITDFSVASMSAASNSAPRYCLVCERGPFNFEVERFESEKGARARAASLWVCWHLFSQRQSGELDEIGSGGVGLGVTRAGIRKYAKENLNPLAVGVAFQTRADRAVGDADIAARNRITFGIVYPQSVGIASSYMFFDKEKPVEKVVAAACSRAGLTLEKGKLAGSPERLNLFTLDGDNVRLDLEIEAHLGSTLFPGAVLLLEKGNRVPPSRLQAIKEVLSG